MLRASPTVRDALHRLGRDNRLLHDVAQLQLIEPGDGAATLAHTFATDPAGAAPQPAMYVIASYLLGSRALCGFDWLPLGVGFQQRCPADTAPFRALFGVEPVWRQDHNWLHFDAAILDLPIAGADTALAAVLDRYAAELLQRLPQPNDIVAQARRALVTAMQDGDPSLESLATRLALAPRTLQRRLRQRHTSHRDLLDELRQALARRHLAQRDLAIEQIAFLLGYQETSAFQRACRRWTGQAPAAYRAANARTAEHAAAGLAAQARQSAAR